MSTKSKRILICPFVSGFLGCTMLAVIANVAVITSPASAEETRQLDSHEHGIGELNIAVDGETVAIELHAPGADIVGFEYVAESTEDRAAIEVAVETLSNPLDLFGMPTAAECSVIQSAAVLETGESHKPHDEYDAHEAHEAHESHDEHDDHSDRGVTHTEFHATYTLTCSNLRALSEIRFTYFNVFEHAHELEVQVLSASGAQAFEVKRDDPTLDLDGVF